MKRYQWSIRELDKAGEVLHFEPSVVDAVRDPYVNAMSLTPTTVKLATK